jgi:hypothetical protein
MFVSAVCWSSDCSLEDSSESTVTMEMLSYFGCSDHIDALPGPETCGLSASSMKVLRTIKTVA